MTDPRREGPPVAPPGLPAGAILGLRGAGVRFGALAALQDVNLDIRRGERVALVGANGSGKSTLLRALHGLLPLDDGCLADVPEGQPVPRMAMVFQRPFLLRMSVKANLELALKLAGVPRGEWPARIAQALQHVRMEHLLGRNARALSLGQQQRLAFARAWVLRPDVLLLDEPTASLDPAAKQEVEAMIAAFVDGGVTLVMSSHNLGQVRRLTSRVLYLEGGRVLVDAMTDEFFETAHAGPAALFMQGEWPHAGRA